MTKDVELYQPTQSTIKVAGRTLAKGAARCAFHYLYKQMFPIDFMCIGGNANQQATIAMSIFCYMVRNAPEYKGIAVAFQPLLYKTFTDDQQEKSVTVWRTILFEPKADEPEKALDEI